MARVRLWFRSVLLRRRLEREMQAEMSEHIERSTERLIARGLSPEEARREAHREFGNVGYLQEEARIARGTIWLDTLLADLRFALRHFIRNPLSTLTIVTVLSLGIGINVVLFTVVYSYVGRPPSGVEASEDRVRIRGNQLGLGTRVERAFSLEEVEAYAELDPIFSDVAAWTSQPVTAGGGNREEITVAATFVTDAYFDLLGTQPILGSTLQGDDAQTAVLSHTVWTQEFANDPNILGRTITLNQIPFTVVGIAPPLFRGAYWEARDGLQVWLPLSNHRNFFPENANGVELFRAVATLRPGVTPEIATAAVGTVAGRIATQVDRPPDQRAPLESRDPSADVAPLLADNMEPGFDAQTREVMLVFGVLGLLTLLVTCTNTSALQTGLALARRREIAIRVSLGASRLRVVRQLVTEGLLLATLAAALAIAVSSGILRILLAIVGQLSFELVFDGTTLGFTFAVALAAGLLFGLSPALHATRPAIVGALKDTAGAVAGGRTRLQRGLVVAQIAFTQPLAVCVAALTLFGILEYRENPRNPYGEQIVQLRLAAAGAWDIPATGGPAAEERERIETERLVDALRELPGVRGAVFVPGEAPISRETFTPVAGAQAGSGDVEPFYLVGQAAMPGYLDVVGIRLVLGRDLEPADTTAFRGGAIPVIIGDDMARSAWGDANPVGNRVERVRTSAEPLTLEVVGVYEEGADASGSSRDNFAVFLPLDPQAAGASTGRRVLIRTSEAPESLTPVLRGVVREELPGVAITELRTLASIEDEERFIVWGGIALIASAGLLVLLLSALGLYAVVAFAVGQRTAEIAVRMAIGARTGQLVRHFASDGLRLTAVGILIGLPLSILGLRMLIQLSADLPEVSLSAVTAIVAAGVLLVTGLATWIPASRAARVEPAIALRQE